jgi:AraC family transcriptional regulator
MKVGTRKHYEELVLRAVEQVRASLDQALDLQELGHKACLSPLHFHRIFKGLLGETPGELHRRMRLERAAFTLLTIEQTIVRVALDAGYDSHEAFGSAFGLAPSEFRQHAAQSPTSWIAASASTLPSRTGIHFAGLSSDSLVRFATEEIIMNVTVKSLPKKRVLAVSHRGPYNMISAAFARLGELLEQAKLDDKYKLEMVAMQYDDPETVAAPDLRSEAGIVVTADAPVPDGLHEVIIPEGRYAYTVHKGPYAQLGDAWGRFMGGWLVQSGERLGDGPCYERYLNTPEDAAPHELETELFLHLS